MKKHFNTTGPVVAEDHYCLDPITRLDWEDVRYLIDTKKYFVLQAPRQTGKTSTLLTMMQLLNEEGEYNVLYVNIEAVQIARNDVALGMHTLISAIASRARDYGIDDRLTAIAAEIIAQNSPL